MPAEPLSLSLPRKDSSPPDYKWVSGLQHLIVTSTHNVPIVQPRRRHCWPFELMVCRLPGNFESFGCWSLNFHVAFHYVNPHINTRVASRWGCGYWNPSLWNMSQVCAPVQWVAWSQLIQWRDYTILRRCRYISSSCLWICEIEVWQFWPDSDNTFTTTQRRSQWPP